MAGDLDLHLTPLRADDERTVRAWLELFLREHLAAWSRDLEGEPWTREAVEGHIARHRLVEREWGDLVRDAGHPDALVRVARERGPGRASEVGRRLGIVCAELREDRYLRGTMGVLMWVFVEPGARRRGIAARLLEVASAWMSWRGALGREVYVQSGNAAAHALYERAGFHVADLRMLAPPMPPKGDFP